MRLITPDDFRDVYIKIYQRGGAFLFSKFNISASARTKSSFNNAAWQSPSWWIIPKVQARWNSLITGNSEVDYETYLTQKLAHKKEIRLLSVGSGTCSHELKLAKLNPHWLITCLDFSEKLLDYARVQAQTRNLNNMRFLADDVYKANFPAASYDVLLFHASLHHFKRMEAFLERVIKWLNPGGLVVINEYVGPDRLQYPRHQIQAINEALQIIAPEYRTVYKTQLKKKRYYGSGLLRMVLADPSECIESASILPALHTQMHIVEEKGYGGNILMPVLKDIAQHFVTPAPEPQAILQRLFDFEDAYLQQYPSDFVFGIYQKAD